MEIQLSGPLAILLSTILLLTIGPVMISVWERGMFMKYYEMNHEKKGKIYEDKVYEEERYYRPDPKKSGMEMVQVAVLICIAVAVGLVFKEKILTFVDSTFDGLLNSGFWDGERESPKGICYGGSCISVSADHWIDRYEFFFDDYVV